MRKMSRNSEFGVRSSEFGVSAAGSRNDFEGTEKLDRYCCFDSVHYDSRYAREK